MTRKMYISATLGRLSALFNNFFFSRWLFLLTFFLIYLCNECIPHEEKISNYLLCKLCGADAADLEYVAEVHSPYSLSKKKYSFAGKQVQLQTLKNPFGAYFDVLALKKSNCIGVGKWEKDNSWFPDFAWKICVCQPKSHFLGWVFEPISSLKDNQTKASDKGFYLFSVENILSEEFSNSLLMIPKCLKN